MSFWDIHLCKRILNQYFLLFWSLMKLLYYLHRTSVTARSCHYDPHSYHFRIKGPDFMTTSPCLSCWMVFSGSWCLLCLHIFKAGWKCQGLLQSVMQWLYKWCICPNLSKIDWCINALGPSPWVGYLWGPCHILTPSVFAHSVTGLENILCTNFLLPVSLPCSLFCFMGSSPNQCFFHSHFPLPLGEPKVSKTWNQFFIPYHVTHVWNKRMERLRNADSQDCYSETCWIACISPHHMGEVRVTLSEEAVDHRLENLTRVHGI